MTALTLTPEGNARLVAEDLLDGRYRLTDLLHRSEAADTWRAQDCRLGREVVIELLYASGEPVQKSRE